MGRGSSGLNKGGNGSGVTEVVVQSGKTIQLNEPLIYGDNDPNVTGALRNSLEKQELKRQKAKIEYGYSVGEDGKPKFGGEIRGERDGVAIPVYVLNNSTAYTHNHPRGKGEEGELGGTFSLQDINVFTQYNLKTFRASAAEGTYSMTKGKKFDAEGLRSYMKSKQTESETKMAQRNKELNDKVFWGKVSYSQYSSEQSKIFNQYLIDQHNALISGQKKYGYTYTLERRTNNG